jgi:hypothetical protein
MQNKNLIIPIAVTMIVLTVASVTPRRFDALHLSAVAVAGRELSCKNAMEILHGNGYKTRAKSRSFADYVTNVLTDWPLYGIITAG